MNMSVCAISGNEITVADKVELVNDFILVQQEKAAQLTNAGLYIPKPEEKYVWVVVATAPNVTEVKVGDKVFVQQALSSEVVVDDTTYYVTKVDELFFKFKKV